MSRYFFHFRIGNRLHEDREGMELPSIEAARDEAFAAARDVMADMIRVGEVPDAASFEVRDARGKLVARVPLQDAASGCDQP